MLIGCTLWMKEAHRILGFHLTPLNLRRFIFHHHTPHSLNPHSLFQYVSFHPHFDPTRSNSWMKNAQGKPFFLIQLILMPHLLLSKTTSSLIAMLQIRNHSLNNAWPNSDKTINSCFRWILGKSPESLNPPASLNPWPSIPRFSSWMSGLNRSPQCLPLNSSTH